MPLAIVTDRCFLLCEKVTSITIQEHESENRIKRKLKAGSRKTKVNKVPTRFTIVICYVPDGGHSQKKGYGNPTSPGEEHSIELDVFGREDAFKLYTEIVEEIREQYPDAGFLDNLVSKMLSGTIEPQKSTIKAKMVDPNADD